ncbi:hypothetical protein AGNV_074 [Anticarsia gemmatalis nucleopolyhedrovirus]|uniref:Chitin-binding type-2 domain-containing protein n=1 Tax=Anticarsia gemmatalis multiple nucleopolyhedrovirus TaxID=268591 RepID=Q06KI0_9ABAC|nr:hypothetical protein AGNV_074 [Anticarsia gemmatalis nucleopolyhedrovirus]ABI13871.1 hypothetical protein AGNV_074 [Anticarsia gemmatalis multiple nucleopolyhedrovirus]
MAYIFTLIHLFIVIFLTLYLLATFKRVPDSPTSTPPPTPSPTPPPTPSPTPPPTPSPTPLPTPSPTPSPLPTPSPTPSPLPTPSPTPSPLPTPLPPSPTPPPTSSPTPPPSPEPLGEPMYFPAEITTDEQLQDFVRPLCRSSGRATYAVPWDCRRLIHCNYFGIPLWTVSCNTLANTAYSFVADDCVAHWRSDCPFYPLNTL